MRFSQKFRNNLTIRHLQSTELFYSFKFLIPHCETCLIEGRKTPNRNTKDTRWRLDGLAFATRLGIFPETENDRGGFHLRKNRFSGPISPINATQLSHQRFEQQGIIGNQASAYRCAGGLRRWHVFRKRTQKGFIVWKLSIFLISSQSNPMRYER